MLRRRWVVRARDTGAWESISRALGVSPLVARVLEARGLAAGEPAGSVERFLRPRLRDLPDPVGIPGMAGAARRVADAVRHGDPIWLYTDYDVDGVTSAALLAEFLEACGATPGIRLPRRDREGYGLHPEAVGEMAAQGARVVITADCGIRAVEAARAARELGVDLVVTDHHTPGPEVPVAAAVVNPRLPGSKYPDDALAGVGVAWNLAVAVRSVLREMGHFPEGTGPDLRELLDLVAIGTVADVAPLVGVNRVLVAAGIERINRTPRPGVRALAEVARVRGRVRAGNIGFQIGPRLNAAGRMQGPREALDVLRSRDMARARELARVLDRVNRERQDSERRTVEAAAGRVDREGWWPDRWSLVVEGDGWHPGIVGLVASRLVERFHRPSVVLSRVEGRLKGSARSVRGLNLVEALSACSDLLARFGGHAAAAGLELRPDVAGDPAGVAAFRDRFEKAVRQALSPEDLVPVLTADAEVGLDELGPDAVRDLGVLEPFGVGNPRPLFVARDVRVLDVRPVGREGAHLRFRVEQGGAAFDAMAWRAGKGVRQVRPGRRVDLAFVPEVAEWKGVERVRLVLEDVRPRE